MLRQAGKRGTSLDVLLPRAYLTTLLLDWAMETAGPTQRVQDPALLLL